MGNRKSVTAGGMLALALLLGGTTLELSAIDLVLPAIPDLPKDLGGTESLAQMVISAFVGGMICGLILFGAIGRKFGRRLLLAASAGAFGTFSLLCALAQSMELLVALRFFQGVAAAAPAVFAPGIVRALFDEVTATRAIAALGSIESLVPAFAPIVGAWLLTMGGWHLSFSLTGVLALLLAAGFAGAGAVIPETPDDVPAGSYMKLLKSRVYLRYMISQSAVLGGLLIFVFAAPAAFVHAMGLTIDDFILTQIFGVGSFIIASNLVGYCVERVGAERLITLGTWVAAAAMFAMTAYLALGHGELSVIIALHASMTVGLGLRAPPGFLRTIIAGDGDDNRASSVMIVTIAVMAAIGTTLLAPFVTIGLLPFAAGSAVCQTIALVALHTLPRLPEAGQPVNTGMAEEAGVPDEQPS